MCKKIQRLILVAWLGMLPVSLLAASPSITFGGDNCSLMVERETYGQILELFKQKAGLQYEIPPELRDQIVPYVSINNLPERDALVKVLEGSNYDYILVASGADSDKIVKLTVTGKSRQMTLSAAKASPPVPFGRRPAVEPPAYNLAPENADDSAAPSSDSNAPPGAQGAPGQQQQPAQTPSSTTKPAYPQGMTPGGQQSSPFDQPSIFQQLPGSSNSNAPQNPF